MDEGANTGQIMVELFVGARAPGYKGALEARIEQ